MLSTVLYYELAMKVPNPVGITVYLLTWGLGHLRCLVVLVFTCKGLFLGRLFFYCIFSFMRNKAVPDPGLRKPHRSAYILIFTHTKGDVAPIISM